MPQTAMPAVMCHVLIIRTRSTTIGRSPKVLEQERHRQEVAFVLNKRVSDKWLVAWRRGSLITSVNLASRLIFFCYHH